MLVGVGVVSLKVIAADTDRIQVSRTGISPRLHTQAHIEQYAFVLVHIFI